MKAVCPEAVGIIASGNPDQQGNDMKKNEKRLYVNELRDLTQKALKKAEETLKIRVEKDSRDEVERIIALNVHAGCGEWEYVFRMSDDPSNKADIETIRALLRQDYGLSCEVTSSDPTEVLDDELCISWAPDKEKR